MKTIYVEQNEKRVIVEVSDELYEEMEKMRRDKWRNDKDYYNHNYSLEGRMEQGLDIEDDLQNPEYLFFNHADEIDKKQKALRLKKSKLRKLHQGMKTLTDKQADAINKRFFLGMSCAEIAEEEGVDASTIRKRIAFSITKLKKSF